MNDINDTKAHHDVKIAKGENVHTRHIHSSYYWSSVLFTLIQVGWNDAISIQDHTN